MSVLVVVICLPLFLAVSGADLLVKNIQPRELRKMGIEIRP
jgi:hypothetical protein